MKRILRKIVIRLSILLFAVFILQPVDGFAGDDDKKEKRARKDSIQNARNLSPHKATLWALLPGGGQIYNHKYWKLPIVYTGFAVIGYFIIQNRDYYILYNDAYICSAKDDAEGDGFTCEDPLALKYSTSDLLIYRDFYRRNVELSFILGGLWYILQMLDATVDAHLSHWEVNENLSVGVEPVFQPVIRNMAMPASPTSFNGLKVSFKF